MIPDLARHEVNNSVSDATDPGGIGKADRVGEPEDLFGCSRTVFGAKILCGLIASINPPFSSEDWGFFLIKKIGILCSASPDMLE